MATFEEALLDGIRSAFCTYLDTFEGFIANLAENPLTPFAKIPLATTRFAQRLVCNREPNPVSNPPFTGGQCAFNYTVNVSWTRKARIAFVCQNVNESNSQINVLGPIAGLEVVNTSTPGEKRLQIIHNNGLSRRDVYTYSGVSGCPAEFVSYAITSVTPSSGGPDTCGDPPNEQPGDPKPSDPIDIDITYIDADGDTFTVPINIVYAPIRVELNGNLTVPFRVQIDPTVDVSFNGTININTGDINIDFGNSNYPPSTLPKPDDYDCPDDIPDYPPTVPNSISPLPPTPPEDDTNTVIRAVIVTVASYNSNGTIIGQDDNPDIYVPNLGFINFAISVDNAIAWTSDIPVKNFRNFIPCEWNAGAVAVRGTPRPGVTWTLTPVRAKVEKPIEFVS